jgi:hypothetical protein
MDRIPALHRRIKELEKTPLAAGTILSFTVIRHPPAGFGSEPYTVAMIEREDGTKVMAQLTRDSAPAAIGAKVIPTMRRIRTMENGLHVNDLKYRVLAAKSAPLITVRAYVFAEIIAFQNCRKKGAEYWNNFKSFGKVAGGRREN